MSAKPLRTPLLLAVSCLTLLSAETEGRCADETLRIGSPAPGTSVSASGASYLPRFEAERAGLVFVSTAKNLVTNDNLFSFLDVFHRDGTSGDLTLVSLNASGSGGGNGHSTQPMISGNGEYVVLVSEATDLVPADTNGVADVFVFALRGRTMRLASRNSEGVPGNGASTAPFISRDGSLVFFESAASNLVPNDTNNTSDVFCHEMASGRTTLVNVDLAGLAGAGGGCEVGGISGEGRYVAFVTTRRDMVPGVTNRQPQVYVRDREQGQTLWASAFQPATTNGPGDYPCTDPVFSGNGAFLTYKAGPLGVIRYELARGTDAAAWSWVPEAPNEDPLCISEDGSYLVYATEGATNRIIRANAAQPVPDGMMSFEAVTTNGARFSRPRLSADGQVVLFVGPPNLTSETCTTVAGVYYRDMRTNTLTPVLVTCSLPHLQESATPDLSGDGRWVAWDSPLETVPGDLNRASDVFIQALDGGRIELVTKAAAGLSASTGVVPAFLQHGGMNGTGSDIVFSASDADWAAGDTNEWLDTFVVEPGSGKVEGWVRGRFFERGNGGQVTSTNTFAYTNSVHRGLLSADARFLVTERKGFYSPTPYFDGPGRYITRHDRMTGLEQVISRPGPTTTDSWDASMSADGRFITFSTDGPEAFNNSIKDPLFFVTEADIVVTDMGPAFQPGDGNDPVRRALTNYVITVQWNAPETAVGDSQLPVLSPDGQWVVFTSRSAYLTTNGNPGPEFHLFASAIPPAGVRMIDCNTNGLPFYGGAADPVFSADSKWLAFEAPGRRTIYLDQMSEPAAGRNEVCRECSSPSINEDGRYVAFRTLPTEGFSKIAVRDMQLGTTEIVSVAANTNENPDDACMSPLISADGRYVVFTSKAGNLVPGDSNRTTDIFIRDRATSRTILASANHLGTGSGNAKSIDPILSRDGLTLAFRSFASDLVPGDYNDAADVFVLRLGVADSDQDGMSDDWEVAYFGDLTRDGVGDLDMDGASDAGEFRAGTDPTNLNSVFRVLTLTYRGPAPGPGITLLWSAVPGKRYRIQFKGEVGEGWRDVPGMVTASSSTASMFWEGQTDGEGAQVFFRVVLVE